MTEDPVREEAQGTFPSREFDCETVINFGKKHRGKTCQQIYNEDSGYLDWMVSKFTGDTFTKRFNEMLNGGVVEAVEEEEFPF